MDLNIELEELLTNVKLYVSMYPNNTYAVDNWTSVVPLLPPLNHRSRMCHFECSLFKIQRLKS